MGRYSKTYSNYVLRKRHQSIKDGTIFERDFSTIGERHNITSNKRRYYFDGNMLFTINDMATIRKRQTFSDFICSYRYNDVKDVVNDINNVKVNKKTNDIRDFVYYGSCFDLIRGSIENIITEFPASIVNRPDVELLTTTIDSSGNVIYQPIESQENGASEHNYLLYNPFKINLYDTDPILELYDNELRYLSLNWKNYNVEFSENNNNWVEEIIDYSSEQGKPSNIISNGDYNRIYTVKLMTRKLDNTLRLIEIHIYEHYNSIVYSSNMSINFEIRPNEDIVNEYFEGLGFFEKQLLNRNSKPLYRNKFITPIETDGWYSYIEKEYKWPIIYNSSYCIDIDSNSYNTFLNSLMDLSDKLDLLWTDNLWKCMTHESIKNFDGAYRREIDEDLESDYIEGSTVMKDTIHFMGRVFDETKRYIDGLKFSNSITYDGYNNAPEAEFSDKLELNGWDVLSTTWSDCENSHPSCYTMDMLSSLFLNGVCFHNGRHVPLITKESPWVKGYGDDTIDDNATKYMHSTWYNGSNYSYMRTNNTDVEFMRRLFLSSRRIFQTKGTIQSIEMLLGLFGLVRGKDYEIKEKLNYTIPYRYNNKFYYYEKTEFDPIHANDYVQPINNILPTSEQLGPKSKKYIKIENEYNNEFTYYELNGDMTVFDAVYNVYMDGLNDDYTENRILLPDLPLGYNYIGNCQYIVPFYDRNKYYPDEDFYFESKGGWGKRSKDPNMEFDYSETISYLKVVNNVESLLNQPIGDISENDIFYVVDYSDYVNYDENIPIDISHFFKLMDADFYWDFSSWSYIPMSGDIVNVVNYVHPNGVTHNDYLKAKYLDEIKPTDFGNNPHTGYGKYDMGKTFNDTMKKPFKYSLENNLISDKSNREIANSFRYKLNEEYTSDIRDKVIDLNRPYIKIENQSVINQIKNGNTWVESHYSDIDKVLIPNEELIKFNDDPTYRTFSEMTDFLENSGYEYIRLYHYVYDKLTTIYNRDDVYHRTNYMYEDYLMNIKWRDHDQIYVNSPNSRKDEYVRVEVYNGKYLQIRDINKLNFQPGDFVHVDDLETATQDKVFYDDRFFIKIDYDLYQLKYDTSTETYKKRTSIRNKYVNSFPVIIEKDAPKYVQVIMTDGNGNIISEEYYQLDERYFINSKLLIISNYNDNDKYKEYFMNYIIHYLMQVIPSTTLLVLDNFNIGVNTMKQYEIKLEMNDDSMGDVYGAGVYNVGETIFITAMAKDGYVFDRWSDGNLNPSRNIMVNNKTLRANFVNAFKVDVITENINQGYVIGGGKYKANTTIRLIAVPEDGYSFGKWMVGSPELGFNDNAAGDCYNATYQLVINEDYVFDKNKGFMAMFVPKNI